MYQAQHALSKGIHIAGRLPTPNSNTVTSAARSSVDITKLGYSIVGRTIERVEDALIFSGDEPSSNLAVRPDFQVSSHLATVEILFSRQKMGENLGSLPKNTLWRE